MGRRFGVVLSIVCLLALPRDSFSQAAVHTVEGTVRVIGTGEPFSGAIVRAFPAFGREVARTTTDVNGRYRLLLPPGVLRLSAELPGYPARGLMGSPLSLERAFPPETREVGLGIAADGTISGMVRDVDGTPARVRVALARTRYRYGRLTIEPMGGGDGVDRTDEEGRYSVSAPAGDYLLVVTGDDGHVQYYPGVAVPEAAIPLRVPPNGEVGGTNVDLAEIETRRVSFSFPLPQPPPQLASVVPIRALLRPMGRGGVDSAPYVIDLEPEGVGVYRTPPLVPGQYEILVNYATEIRRAMPQLDWNTMDPITRFAVRIVDDDVDVGRILPGPYAEVSGRVILPSDTGGIVDLSQVPGFSLVDTAFGVPNGRLAVPRADGTFTIEGVSPGLYSFETRELPSAWPDGWYIAGVRAGGRDVLQNGLEVASTAPPLLDIVIGGGGGRVAGRVERAGIAVPGAHVTLIAPETGPMWRPFEAWAGDDGTFSLDAVPPGEYRVVAFEDLAVPPGRWEDPAFRAAVRPMGSPLSVLPGEQVTADIELGEPPR